jgi:hypothetical protein
MASKKAFAAHQPHRTLGVVYKAASFMAHCIRQATRDLDSPAMCGSGKAVEVDETAIGRLEGVPKQLCCFAQLC